MSKQPLWRSTPLASFPAILGLMGLSVVWAGLARAFQFTSAVGDLALGVSTVLLGYFVLAYIAKLLARPAVLMEDLRSPPGRAGLSAASMAVMVLSIGLLPFGEVARYVWWVGIGLHGVVLVFVVLSLLKAPAESRSVTPFQYLPFVGYVLAPLAGVQLGYGLLSQVLAYGSLVAFVWLTLKIALKLRRTLPPQPLRPPLAIILSPLSLFGIAFAQFGSDIGFLVFYVLAWVAALTLLVFARWMTNGGFTPMWGSLTFPVATFININLVAMGKGFGIIATTGAIAGAVIGTPLILYVAYKTLKMWAKRDLAKKTGAAVA